MEEYAGSEALDAGPLAGGQAVEHYEMSRYGTLKAWGRSLACRACELVWRWTSSCPEIVCWTAES
jgi:ferritin-like metal-binding protein YciE